MSQHDYVIVLVIIIIITDLYSAFRSEDTEALLVHLLSQHDYVIVLALDFSKAFDSVRHSTLFDKLARLYIPDYVYNWLVEYFQGHSHCTKYENNTSALADISASIILLLAQHPT